RFITLSAWVWRQDSVLSVTQESPRNVTILLWYWPFRRTLSLEGDMCLEWYGIPNCMLVNNQSFFSRADVVIFHHHELKTGQQHLPLHLLRPEKQAWVWLSLESPQTNGNLRWLAGHFNWVMSYRRDADIPIPYGVLQPKVSKMSELADTTVPQNKSALACWVVSNYKPFHKRSKVYNTLKNIIPIKVYGRWMKQPLDKQNLLTTISQCYFYLAFENSISRDYITEKLWRNAFLGGSVPVVLGPPREEYEAIIPKDSFIHVNDFDSLEALGEFMKDLSRDEKRYLSYFAWRRTHSVKMITDWRERMCNICTIFPTLQSDKRHQDLEAWTKGQ
uniref:Fucosyltransferase n=1 Tax=Denticeps clupeoides TaxID=299321 RepID=A0AAY4E6W1_9TELE